MSDAPRPASERADERAAAAPAAVDRPTIETLLVEIGGFRPRREGAPPSSPADDPIFRRLLRREAEAETSAAGGRYAELLRRLTRR